MIIAFELTMPHCNTWNGHWGGENDLHVITYSSPNYSPKRMKELDGQSFFYRWDDGWTARISCRIVDAKEARALRKRSAGFCGYSWMVRSIWVWGEILTDEEIAERAIEGIKRNV